MRNKATWMVLMLTIALLGTTALGQRTTATLFGIVQDPTGGVVPGVSIELTNQQTNTKLTAVSNDVGEFTFSFVPVGRYDLKAELTGFKTHVRTGLELTSGQQIRYPIALEVGEINDVTTVKAEAPLLQSAAVTKSDGISNLQLAELPQSRRDFTTLLGLQNGMRFDKQGMFSINGLATAGITITVDGVDAAGDPETSSLAAFQGFNLINVMSQEAIQEVVVSKGVMSAEVARTFSGNINVISKSGTNDFHGSLFETIQNDALNARNGWATSTQKTPVRYNQFGGSIGGPIIRDKAFFFFTYEGYRQRNSGIYTRTVPTPEFRAQAIAALPTSKAFFDLWPDPTESYAPGAAGANARYIDSGTANDDHFVARGDWNINSTNFVTARYTGGSPNKKDVRDAIGNPRQYFSENDSGNATWTRSAATWANEVRAGLNFHYMERTDSIFANDKTIGIRIDNLYRADGEGLMVTGHSYSFEDIFSKTKGRHTLKVGALYMAQTPGRNDEEVPVFRYKNASDFLKNKPREVTFTFGQPRYYGRMWQFGGFFQDDFRVRPNLVLNLGVRYEYYSVFSEKNGMIFNPGKPENAVKVPAVFRDPDSLYNGDFNNFQPRVGFAWGIGKDSRTVIRSGFGINVAQPNLRQFSSMVYVSPLVPWRAVFDGNMAAQYNLKYPLTNEQMVPVISGQDFPRSYHTFDADNLTPYVMQWTLDIQRQLTPTIVFETGYVGNKALKILMSRDMNVMDRQTGERPHPEAAQFDYDDASDFSYYHAWQTSLRKNLSHNVSFGVNYTWSRVMALSQGDFWPGNDRRVQDQFNLRADLGPTDLDRPHRLSVNWFWDAPFAQWAGATGALAKVIGGWRVGGILSATSGQPLNIEQKSDLDFSRPDYVGGDPYSTAPDPDRYQKWYLNPAAFAAVPENDVSGLPERPGNVGKNSLRGHKRFGFDLSASKTTAITEKVNLQLRGEFLSVLNHPTLNDPDTMLGESNFGKILGVGGSRVIQMSLKLTF